MKPRYFLIPLLMVLLGGMQVMYASGDKMGTAGAIELLIPMGARNAAMCGSNIANIQGAEAMYYNPSGLSMLNGAEASFSYMSYFADMNISYIAVGSKVGKLGAIGLSIQSLDIGKIPVTTLQNPEGTGEELSTNFITLTATFSRQFTERINFGINTKLISEKVGNMSARALAWDFGLQYTSPWGVDFGVVMRNIGSNIQFDGTSIEFDTEIPFSNPNATTRKTRLDMASHELPASLNLGVAYRYQFTEEHSVNVSGIYGNNNYTLDQIDTGIEYSFKDFFFLRGGYNAPLYPGDYDEDMKDDYQYSFTFGFGLALDVGDNALVFDYAYREMASFDGNQYFTLGIRF